MTITIYKAPAPHHDHRGGCGGCLFDHGETFAGIVCEMTEPAFGDCARHIFTAAPSVGSVVVAVFAGMDESSGEPVSEGIPQEGAPKSRGVEA
jgi:hypothetical protein